MTKTNRHAVSLLVAASGLFFHAGAAEAQRTLSARARVTCEVQEGAVYCWGSDQNGQVPSASGRVRVSGLPSMRSVSVGDRHVCALATDGAVWCWGDDRWAQLGAVSVGPGPVAVPGVRATFVAAGGNATCAIVERGQVSCWGNSEMGVAGEATSVATPRLIRGVVGARRLAVGDAHACAEVRDGRVLCWGEGRAGELGDGRRRSSLRPRRVSGLSGSITQMVAGSNHTCVIIQGALFCWGAHSLGSGTNSAATAGGAQRLTSFGEVRSVAAGKVTICAVGVDGVARCAGRNDFGQVGSPPASFRAEPRPIPGLGSVGEVALGLDHGCARAGSGAVLCWGSNAQGQAGQPPPRSTSSPREVRLPGPARDIGVGGHQSCALLRDGRLFCWGRDTMSLAFTARDVSPMGVRRVPAEVGVFGRAREVQTSGPETCVLNEAGQLRCIAPGRFPTQLTSWPAEPPSPASLGVGGRGGCGVARGDLRCWGPLLAERYTFDGLGGAPFEATQVAVGAMTSCARSVDGRVACWGRATYGLLGDGTGGTGDVRDRPGLVPGLVGVTDLSVGWRHACVVASDGGVRCWGSGHRGATGLMGSDAPTPREVRGVQNIRQVDVGGMHTCALDGGGRVFCWGDTARGQTGRPFGRGNPSPQRVAGLPEASEIDLGDYHSCALATDGRVFCWGRSHEGELGDGQGFLLESAAPVNR